jgi:hypothetical protein
VSLTYADIDACYRNGRFAHGHIHKTVNQPTTSGIAVDLSILGGGNPPPQYYPGTPLTSSLLSRSADGGLNHGANKSPMKKYLHQLVIRTTLSTAVPLEVAVLDYCAFYTGIGMDAGVQLFNTTQQTTRHTTGLQMMLVELFPYLGNAQCQITYTNDQGVAGRQTPIFNLNTQTTFGTIATDGPASAGLTGVYVPFAHGDSGILYPEQIEFFGAGDIGVLALVLVKPIATAIIYETTAVAPWDFLLHQNDLPPIVDDAYLNLVVTPPGTLSGGVISGRLTTIWSD